MIHRWNHQYFVAGTDSTFLFQLHQILHDLRTGKLLLYLVATHSTHDGNGLFSASEAESLNFE
jgi:hypothetical protein